MMCHVSSCQTIRQVCASKAESACTLAEEYA